MQLVSQRVKTRPIRDRIQILFAPSVAAYTADHDELVGRSRGFRVRLIISGSFGFFLSTDQIRLGALDPKEVSDRQSTESITSSDLAINIRRSLIVSAHISRLKSRKPQA
jgi:hypothetical protein